MPQDKKILNQLLLAKKMSDKENYVAKYNLMNKLLKDHPDEFYVDQDHPDYPGIVHAPTGFRMHLPRQATYGIEKKAAIPFIEDLKISYKDSKDIPLFPMPGLKAKGLFIPKSEFKHFKEEFNSRFPGMNLPDEPTDLIAYNSLLPKKEIKSIIKHERNHADIIRKGGLSAINQAILTRLGRNLTHYSGIIGGIAGAATGNAATGLAAGGLSAMLGETPVLINEHQAKARDGSIAETEGFNSYKKFAIQSAINAALFGGAGALVGNLVRGWDKDKFLGLPSFKNPFSKKATYGIEKKSFSPDLTAEEMQEAVDSIYDHKAPRLASMKAWPQEWLDDQDKMGWLEWYKNYSEGRRSDTDEKQIKRWNSFKARHGSQFLANPTPRRAYALRNWAIDPIEMLPEDQRESFQKLMEAYKAKEYKKWDKKKAKEKDNTLE